MKLMIQRINCLAVILSQKVVGLFFGGLNAASTLSVMIVVLYGAYLTITGSMTAGSLTSFILYSLTGNLFFSDVYIPSNTIDIRLTNQKG